MSHGSGLRATIVPVMQWFKGVNKWRSECKRGVCVRMWQNEERKGRARGIGGRLGCRSCVSRAHLFYMAQRQWAWGCVAEQNEEREGHKKGIEGGLGCRLCVRQAHRFCTIGGLLKYLGQCKSLAAAFQCGIANNNGWGAEREHGLELLLSESVREAGYVVGQRQRDLSLAVATTVEGECHPSTALALDVWRD